ncbi:MAG TPA: hypothetical protein VFJ21_12635 [Mycobacteriales bacterium]|nr:hypothetical protein [Mycobacteriales bacterium]
MGNTPNLATISEKVTPVETTVSLCVDGALFAEHERLEAELDALMSGPNSATLGGGDPVSEAAKKVQAVEKKMRGRTYDFAFRHVPTWQALLDEHGPREGKERIERFNPETFPAAAVSASCVSPEGMGDAETFAAFWDKLNRGQRARLFDGAYRANEDGASVPFSVTASAVLSSSRQSSTSVGLAASH